MPIVSCFEALFTVYGYQRHTQWRSNAFKPFFTHDNRHREFKLSSICQGASYSSSSSDTSSNSTLEMSVNTLFSDKNVIFKACWRLRLRESWQKSAPTSTSCNCALTHKLWYAWTKVLKQSKPNFRKHSAKGNAILHMKSTTTLQAALIESLEADMLNVRV